jgi:hypothetical protein
LAVLAATCCAGLYAQQPPPPQPNPKPGQPAREAQWEQPETKRLFGVIPNFRTSPTLENYEPLTVGGKWKIARDDAFDRGTVYLAAAFAGEGQLTRADPEFDDGVPAYARYLGTAYADFVIGDFMTEAVYPSLLHQDPRYFRKNTGSGWARLGYACGQIFMTHNDSGRTAPNYSEIVGNSTAVAISTAYYQSGRDAASATAKLGTQLGVDMAANILKEFWPEISHSLSRKHH